MNSEVPKITLIRDATHSHRGRHESNKRFYTCPTARPRTQLSRIWAGYSTIVWTVMDRVTVRSK